MTIDTLEKAKKLQNRLESIKRDLKYSDDALEGGTLTYAILAVSGGREIRVPTELIKPICALIWYNLRDECNRIEAELALL
jgi:hypothetical protein